MDFTKCAIGTRVVSTRGIGCIDKISLTGLYPIRVRFDAEKVGYCTYTADGRLVDTEVYPSLYLAPYEWPSNEPKPTPEKEYVAHVWFNQAELRALLQLRSVSEQETVDAFIVPNGSVASAKQFIIARYKSVWTNVYTQGADTEHLNKWWDKYRASEKEPMITEEAVEQLKAQAPVLPGPHRHSCEKPNEANTAKKSIDRDPLAENAALLHSAYKAYVTAGFTDEQAFELVAITLSGMRQV